MSRDKIERKFFFFLKILLCYVYFFGYGHINFSGQKGPLFYSALCEGEKNIAMLYFIWSLKSPA
jgi:hypothetical protein